MRLPDVHVPEPVSARQHRPPQTLLLDVRVMRVEVYLDVGLPDLVHERRRLRRGVQHVGLVPVHHLQTQDDVRVRRASCDASKRANGVVVASGVARRVVFAERRVEHAAHVRSAHPGGDVERGVEERLSAFRDSLVRRRDVGVEGEAEGCGGAEVMLGEDASGHVGVDGGGVEERDLDEVVAGLRGALARGAALGLGPTAGPDERVDTERVREGGRRGNALGRCRGGGRRARAGRRARRRRGGGRDARGRPRATAGEENAEAITCPSPTREEEEVAENEASRARRHRGRAARKECRVTIEQRRESQP